MLRELWQKEGWMGRKWKGLLPCSSSCCTDWGGASREGTWIVLLAPSPLILHCSTSPRKHNQSPEGQVVKGSRLCQTAVVSMYLLLLLAALGICSFSCSRGYKEILPSAVSIWRFVCKLYHSHAYLTVNLKDNQFFVYIQQICKNPKICKKICKNYKSPM